MFQRRALCGNALLLALHALTILSDFSRACFGGNDIECITWFRRAIETEDFCRHRRQSLLHLLISLVHQSAYLAPLGASDDNIASCQRSAFDQDGRDRPTTFVELRLHNNTVGFAFRICCQFQKLRLKRDSFREFIQTSSLKGGDFNGLNLTTHRFDLNIMLQQIGENAACICVLKVNLVHGNDDRNFRSLGVFDGFDGLRHDGVIRRDH